MFVSHLFVHINRVNIHGSGNQQGYANPIEFPASSVITAAAPVSVPRASDGGGLSSRFSQLQQQQQFLQQQKQQQQHFSISPAYQQQQQFSSPVYQQQPHCVDQTQYIEPPQQFMHEEEEEMEEEEEVVIRQPWS